jgi:hypothetical protein
VKPRSRSVLAAVAAIAVLSGCRASAPPARELANEMIATLERDGTPLSDSVKECMRGKVTDFRLTDAEQVGFKDLDDAAKKAADGQEQALDIIARFTAELKSCNTAG